MILPVAVQPALQWQNRPWNGANWLLLRRGPGATNHFEGGGFDQSNEDVDYPNLMFHFLPSAIRYDGSVPAGGHGYQVHIGPIYSDARGSVKIRSADPRVHPELRFNYLSTAQDRREWPEAVRVARSILSQPAFDRYNDGELSPGPDVQSDEQILDWVGKDAETALHPGQRDLADLQVPIRDGSTKESGEAFRLRTPNSAAAGNSALARAAADRDGGRLRGGKAGGRGGRGALRRSAGQDPKREEEDCGSSSYPGHSRWLSRAVSGLVWPM